MIQIEPFCKEHLPLVVGLEQACFSKPWSENSLLEEIISERACFLVATEKERVVGYLSASFVLDECAINRVAVAKDARRKGTATQLLQALLQWAKGQDIAVITLEVRQSNLAAIALYQHFGFCSVGVRPHFYSHPAEDGFLMRLEKEELYETVSN